MATMVDVARRAGVSIATVSHVLNGTRTVREETSEAVRQAIADLGYIPNTVARSLVTARSNTLGLAVSAFSNPYFTEILQGVESAALEGGYGLLVSDPHDDPKRELEVVQLLHQRRVDGVIIAPSADPRPLLSYLDTHDLPAVFLDRFVGGRYDQVGAQNAEPMAELVGHLVELGHRRIGFIAGRDGLSTSQERLDGYRKALQDNGIRFVASRVRCGDSEADGAAEAVRELLSARTPPTALVAANNAMTLGALRELRAHGLRVPEDMALVAFDDFEWADLFRPHLTAIAQPSRELGAEAVRLLLARLADPTAPPKTVRLPCALRHRESCGCRTGLR